MSEILVNKETGERKEIPTGFSWTTLFFGLFVPLIRGYFVYFFILLALCVFGFGFIIAWLVCPFLINKHYKEHLLKNGWMTEQAHNKKIEEIEKKERKEAEDAMFQKAFMAKMLDK